MPVPPGISKRNPLRPPKQIVTEDIPSPRLAAALAEMRDGEFIEYASVEAIRADVAHHKKGIAAR